MPIAAPFNLAQSVRLGSGVWKVGSFNSYTAGGATVLIGDGLRDIGEIDSGTLTLDPGTPTNFNTKRVNTRDTRFTVPGQKTITLDLTTFSMNQENLSLWHGGTVETITQAATPVTDELIMGIRKDNFYALGITDADPVGVRGISAAPTITAGPASLTAWSTGTVTAKYDVVGPSTPDGKVLVALNAGTTDASTEPTWPTTVGDTIVDNDVTWLLTSLASSDTFTDGTDFQSDITGVSGARIRWDSTNAAIAVFADYTPNAVSWQRIKGGEVISYSGYAEFHGDVSGSEEVLQFPLITIQSNGALESVTDEATFLQMAFQATVQTVEGLAPYYWGSNPA